MRGVAALLAMLVLVPVAVAAAAGSARVSAPDDESRARQVVVHQLSRPAIDYAATCAGCHGPSGQSVAEMPSLVGRIGYFARSAEGRAYLVAVPNVAMSPLADEELAAMLSWLLRTYSAAELPADFQDYTAAEVGAARQQRIVPWQRRREVVAGLLAAGRLPSAAVLE